MVTAPIPQDRIVEALAEVWASLADLLAALDDGEWHLPSPLPGWDVQDNVAHIVGTEAMLLGEPGPEAGGDRPPHVHNDIGAMNEAWVASMRDLKPAEMLARLRGVTERRLTALRSMTNDEWDADSFTPAGRSTYGRFMQIRVFDCWLHEQDVRDATGRPGHETGLAVEVTLDELRLALGFVVGKRAGVPAGRSVTFALTDGGAVVRRFHVDVAERAQVVDELAAASTTTLTMPVGVMTRLAAGRVRPAEVRDRVAVDGDEALAATVLDHLGYTI